MLDAQGIFTKEMLSTPAWGRGTVRGNVVLSKVRERSKWEDVWRENSYTSSELKERSDGDL